MHSYIDFFYVIIVLKILEIFYTFLKFVYHFTDSNLNLNLCFMTLNYMPSLCDKVTDSVKKKL